MVNGLFRLKGPALRYHVKWLVVGCAYTPCAYVGFIVAKVTQKTKAQLA